MSSDFWTENHFSCSTAGANLCVSHTQNKVSLDQSVGVRQNCPHPCTGGGEPPLLHIPHFRSDFVRQPQKGVPEIDSKCSIHLSHVSSSAISCSGRCAQSTAMKPRATTTSDRVVHHFFEKANFMSSLPKTNFSGLDGEEGGFPSCAVHFMSQAPPGLPVTNRIDVRELSASWMTEGCVLDVFSCELQSPELPPSQRPESTKGFSLMSLPP